MEIIELFEQGVNNTLANIPQCEIEIGVFANKSQRKIKKLFSIGITNAELMFIHENGSPLRNIPARPVLHMTLDYAKTQLPNVLPKWLMIGLSKGPDAYIRELEKFCLRLENYARQIIYSNDGRLAPNTPTVAKRKKGNHPLFDTGQLARSIVCRVVKL